MNEIIPSTEGLFDDLKDWWAQKTVVESNDIRNGMISRYQILHNLIEFFSSIRAQSPTFQKLLSRKLTGSFVGRAEFIRTLAKAENAYFVKCKPTLMSVISAWRKLKPTDLSDKSNDFKTAINVTDTGLQFLNEQKNLFEKATSGYSTGTYAELGYSNPDDFLDLLECNEQRMYRAEDGLVDKVYSLTDHLRYIYRIAFKMNHYPNIYDIKPKIISDFYNAIDSVSRNKQIGDFGKTTLLRLAVQVGHAQGDTYSMFKR